MAAGRRKAKPPPSVADLAGPPANENAADAELLWVLKALSRLPADSIGRILGQARSILKAQGQGDGPDTTHPIP